MLALEVRSPAGYVPLNGQVPEAIQATIGYQASPEAEVV
jgi:hypothetical protein